MGPVRLRVRASLRRGQLGLRWGLAAARSHQGSWCVSQADSPEEMHSWIRAIAAAVQALKTRPRVGHVLAASYLASNEGRANVPGICLVDCVNAWLARFQGEIPARSGSVCQSREKVP